MYGAKGIARAFGMTETLIGLTIVAVGTSLPELVTSVVAAKKGETDLAVGNVIGCFFVYYKRKLLEKQAFFKEPFGTSRKKAL